MTSKLKYLFLAITFIELIIIFLLGFLILRKNLKGNVLGSNVEVNPISRKGISLTTEDTLKYFYELTPNYTETEEVNWLTYKPTYTYNADGLNERFDYSVNKPHDVYRIIVLGDSFTFGVHVNTSDNYTEKLEELLNNTLRCENFNKFEVINFGVSGYDIQYSVHRYEIRGQKYNPDIVVWLMQDNDFTLPNEVLQEKVKMYDEQIQASNTYEFYKSKGDYYPEWTMALRDIKEDKSYDENFFVKKEYDQLEVFSNLYAGPLVIYTHQNTPSKYKTLMKMYADSRKKTWFYDGIGQYDALPETHPSVKGHELIARTLFDYILTTNIIPCKQIK